MRIRSLITVFVLLLIALPLFSQIYYYRDRSGKLVFTNIPHPKAKRYFSYRYFSGFDLSTSARKRAFLREYGGFIEQISRKYGVDSKLIYSIIEVESDYHPYAVSRKGAKGLMQLLPETARRHGASDVFNPYENIEAGVKHLRYLLDYYHGNLTLALAAYNAGVNAVNRYKGIPPYRETRRYVRKVYSRYLGTSSIPEVDLGRKGRRVSSSRSKGRVYRYLDDKGRICFTNLKPVGRRAKR